MWLMVVVLLCNVFLCKLAHIGLQPVKWCTKVLSYSNRNDDKYPPSRWKQLIVLSLYIHWTIKIPSGVNPMFIFFSCQIFHFALGNHKAVRLYIFWCSLMIFVMSSCLVPMPLDCVCLVGCRRRPFFSTVDCIQNYGLKQEKERFMNC